MSKKAAGSTTSGTGVKVYMARRIEVETKSIIDAVEESTDTVAERFDRAVRNAGNYELGIRRNGNGNGKSN